MFLLISTGLPCSVTAQSNNTLEWGVSVDEEFTYVLQRDFFADQAYRAVVEYDIPYLAGLTLGEKAIMRVTALDAIPSLINESEEVPTSSCSLGRANDSVSIITDASGFVIPIGDWEFLEAIGNLTSIQGITLIDTADEWGTQAAGSFQASDDSIISVYVEMRYEKENGTLNYLRHRYSTLGTDIIDVIFVHWYEGMPTILGEDLQLSTILIIAIGGVIGLIIAFLVLQAYRGKKPLVQRLGE